MAERDFYNIGDFITYPLVDGLTDDNDFALIGGGFLPRQGLADAGFMFGAGSGFVAAQHNVYLFEVTVTLLDVVFDFRSDAPGLSGFRWLFSFPVTGTLGCSAYVGVTPIVGGLEDTQLGYGYVNIGELTDLVGLGVGTYTLVMGARVEPALLQSLVDTFVSSITVADDPRTCPPECCADSSSSSSSFSSSSFSDAGGALEAFPVGGPLVGDVKLIEGYNCQLTTNQVLNAIVINAGVGLGAGQPCHDIVVDHTGLRLDDCVTCDSFIKSINGVTSPSGELFLSGGNGFTVVAFPDQHKLVVKVTVTKDCTSSLSSSSSSA